MIQLKPEGKKTSRLWVTNECINILESKEAKIERPQVTEETPLLCNVSCIIHNTDYKRARGINTLSKNVGKGQCDGTEGTKSTYCWDGDRCL